MKRAPFKKFILFQHEWQPAGGMGDIVDSFDTIEEARVFAAGTALGLDYSEIVDRDTWEIEDQT